MPDTPIDQSAGIQSIRLKVPTGTVPVPPAGYAQLHSPSPGTLALRLPDGSVVEIGGGGGGTPGVLSGTGGVVEALFNPFTGAGVTVTPAAEETIFLNGPVVGPGPTDPQAPGGVTLAAREADPPLPAVGLVVLYTLDGETFRVLDHDGDPTFRLSGGGDARCSVSTDVARLTHNNGATVQATAAIAQVSNGAMAVQVQAGEIDLDVTTGALILLGVGTVDPLVNGQVWINPVTRALTVSAG